MNPKDIVYKMVVLGRRLTTHFILDIFWGSSFIVRARKPPERTFGIKLLIHVIKPPVVEALLQITYVKEGFHYWWFHE